MRYELTESEQQELELLQNKLHCAWDEYGDSVNTFNYRVESLLEDCEVYEYHATYAEELAALQRFSKKVAKRIKEDPKRPSPHARWYDDWLKLWEGANDLLQRYNASVPETPELDSELYTDPGHGLTDKMPLRPKGNPDRDYSKEEMRALLSKISKDHPALRSAIPKAMIRDATEEV